MNDNPLDHKLLHLQLVNALTLNDPDLVLDAIFKINTIPYSNEQYGSPLHLVVSISPLSLVENVISVFCTQESTAANKDSLLWINALNSDKETPLHIASKLSRLDVLELLFQINSLNDTIRQIDGKTAHEMATNDKVAQLFVKHRDEYINILTASMKNAVLTGDHAGMEALFENNIRAHSYLKQGWIDINASIDQQSERSLLHMASKTDNLELVVWAMKFGADPNVKDAKNKRPIDLAKSDKVKEILKHAKSQAPIVSASLQQATSSNLTGKLVKEAPILKGLLSKVSNINKWTNYKDGYQQRYFVLENGVFSYYHDINDYPASCRGSISTLSVNAYFPDSKNDHSRFDVTGSGNVKYSLKARSPADAKKWVWALMESKVWMSDASKKGSASNIHSRRNSIIDPKSNELTFENSLYVQKESFDSPTASEEEIDQIQVKNEDEEKDGLLKYLDKHGSTDFQSVEMRRFLVLLTTEMQVQKETVQSALDLVSQVSKTPESSALKSLLKVPPLLQDSSAHIEALIFGIIRHCNKREFYWSNRLARANETHRRLEEIVQKMALIDSSQIPTVEINPIVESELLAPVPIPHKTKQVDTDCSESDDEEFYDAQDFTSSFVETALGFDPPIVRATSPRIISKVNTVFLDPEELKESLVGYDMTPRTALPIDPTTPLPSLAVWSFLKSAIGKDLSKITLPVLFNEPLSMLQRMCEDIEFIELLSLASRIGSKGTAPSLTLSNQPALEACKNLGLDYDKLEGLAEVDAGVLRVMFVGAFAMSNYSSTVGRTSKPFNPLLVVDINKGETFELISSTKNYRYISEQVCHHPPISACFCDSPDFEFWTEVYVKSKFWGKSLELNPLGTCHVSLPWGQGTEHYSWKKVTTCVNNLILGTLTIEHYGDLIVKNHRTGEECVITFKPKDSGGWFGGAKDARGGTIVGSVKDSKGIARYSLEGKWDESLIATPLTESKYSHTPFKIWQVNPKPVSSGSKTDFNLTSFGLSLNQSTPELDSILPRTDSRLRPDQKAMEHGQWEDADLKKEACESLQRSRRKQIVAKFEETQKPDGPPKRGIEFGERWWSPRWFIREIEKDTNEEHWRFSNEYWQYRNKVAHKIGTWPDYINDIFGISNS